MAKINFTTPQQKAIDSSGKNILVSAGAGSGKTAVLSERVIQKVIKGIPIESLVVLTFTNAAAKEMKMRIRNKLMNEEPTENITNAIQALDASHIQTFDSFALFILKKYGYYQNISKNVSIGDSVRITLLKKAMIDELFLTYYEQEDEAFLDYIKTYEIKDDKTLKEQIIYFHNQLVMHTNFDELLEKFTLDYFNESTFNRLFNRFLDQIKETQVAFKRSLDSLYETLDSDIAIQYVDTVYHAFSILLKTEDYDTLYHFIQSNPSLPNSASTTKKLNAEENTLDKDRLDVERADLKKMLDRLKNDYLIKPKEAHYKDFINSSKHIPIIKTLIKQLDERYLNAQIEREMMDFSTVARLAYKIITENSLVKEELTSSIHEVMIDEYQDTNHMQESFIHAITENNVYMVGDVKQSIYRFRHAEPKLFTDKYNRYQKDETGMNIDLNANFRSRKEMLDDINTVFKSFMDHAIGGVAYTDNQMLKYGNKTYDNATDDYMDYGLQLDLIDASTLDEDSPYTKDEIEIFHIAQDINKKIAHGKIYDESIKSMRKVSYKDFTILVSVSTRFEQIKQILEFHKIPVNIIKSDPFINYHDIDFYRHILKTIYALTDDAYYKDHFKHSFLSLTRSYCFEYKDDDVIKQVMQLPKRLNQLKNHHYLEAFQPFFTQLLTLKDNVTTLTIENLWQEIIDAFNLYEHLVKLKDTASAVNRLDYLCLMIRRLTQEGFTLKELVYYFDQMLELELDVEFEVATSHDGDYVTLMTIHKSKGLEFPIVYLPHLNHRFNRQSMRSYHFDLDLGFLFEHVDQGLTQSFLYPLKRDLDLKEDISERMRLLYVALTRAKEACIIPMVLDKVKPFRFNDDGMMLDYDRIHNLSSFYDMFIAIQDQLSHRINSYDASRYPLTLDYQYTKTFTPYKNGSKEIKTYIPYEQPLKTEALTSFSAKIDTLLTPSQLDNIAFGNLMHHYLELINFTRNPFDQITQITENKAHQQLLESFFNQPLFSKISIKKAYKEFPFALEDEELTTTGYIDLLLETEEAFIIIDYKLKTIDKEAYVNQIKGYESILKRLSDKTVTGYLYSIIDKTFRKIL
jgi:ATP-dependent helicase/nuclease subunit A